MNREFILQLVKSDYTKLVFILIFAFYIAFIPNLGYNYPVHIDEWVHMSYSNEIIAEESVDITYPFDGDQLKLIEKMELGFQTFLAVVHTITGISQVVLFRYLPSFIFMLTVLGVYMFARREGYGWQAAFMTCFITSTIGILGPAFTVPVALALAFVPLILFLAFNFRNVWSYISIFILICFLIAIHGPSAICAVLIMAPYIVLSIRREPLHSLWLALVIVGPFVITLPLTYNLATGYLSSLLETKSEIGGHDLPEILLHYGYLPIVVCLLGTFLLSLKGGIKNYSVVLALVVVTLMLAVFYTLSYGIGIVYLRGLLFCMLMMGITGGAALKEIGNLKIPEKIGTVIKNPAFMKYAGAVVCLTVIVVTLVTALPSRLDEGYYRMINDTDYEAFTWVRDNLGPEYDVALLDPWKGTVFTALTGKHVYVRIHEGATKTTDAAYEYIRGGCKDTEFLRTNDISIIYTLVFDSMKTGNVEYPPENPDITEAREYIYVLNE
ncbi:MAG: hypothetical protein JW712_14285 [Dehalococcoidales bacterium]|nr:hypothetical protein [Dehalococcoidales bacterium]